MFYLDMETTQNGFLDRLKSCSSSKEVSCERLMQHWLIMQVHIYMKMSIGVITSEICQKQVDSCSDLHTSDCKGVTQFCVIGYFNKDIYLLKWQVTAAVLHTTKEQ